MVDNWADMSVVLQAVDSVPMKVARLAACLEPWTVDLSADCWVESMVLQSVECLADRWVVLMVDNWVVNWAAS